MEGVISYRPRMGKRKLESLLKAKPHYKSVNQFIDHAVARALREEFGQHPLAKRIADIVYQAVADHAPLRFVKPAAEELKEIEAAAERASGPGKLVSAEEILKRHKK
jgi:6-pyruvoyl-tetrahydropterin synthase